MQSSTYPALRRLGKTIQLGHVVRDIDASLQFWTQVMGVGPFVMLESSLGGREFFHRNAPTPANFAIALSYFGDVMVELIMPLDDAPSPYRDFLESGREGLHHIGFWPKDFFKTCHVLEQSGFTEVSSIRQADGTRDIIYCDAPDAIGVMVELADMTPLRTAFLSGIKQLTEDWDGTNPVRRYASRQQFIDASKVVS